MSRLSVRLFTVLLMVAAVLRCATPHQSVKPQPPSSTARRPISDPPPSRVIIHVTVFREALMKKLAENLPRQGEGEAELIAGQKLRYSWQRQPLALRFDRGRIFVTVPVTARFNLLGEREIPIDVTIAGEPVVTADFKALLQSTEVQVQANGSVDAVNRAVEAKLRSVVSATLNDFRFDLRPTVNQAFARLSQPLVFSVGEPLACAELHIAALEAAPTVLADGLEKDLAAVVLPSVTLPCTPLGGLQGGGPGPDGGPPAPTARFSNGGLADGGLADGGVALAPGSTSNEVPGTTAAPGTPDGGGTPPPWTPHPLPLLANVASLPTGPFKVVVPVAARYEELSLALEHSMGKRLFFSSTYPELYLEKPAVYPSDDTVVIRMVLGGKAQVAGIDMTLSGELYFAGHPHVIDNQITVPDLEITPGTANELVKLKFALDYASIRDQARDAIRVDVSERLAAVKNKLSTELSFDEGNGCVRAQVLHTEVTGIYPHPSFLRIYTQVDAQVSMYLPCKN